MSFSIVIFELHPQLNVSHFMFYVEIQFKSKDSKLLKTSTFRKME